MNRKLEGRVALVTGGARAQGLSHAQLLAEEGADVILVDSVSAIDTIAYEMPGPDELDEAAEQVRSLGGRAITIESDVRDGNRLGIEVAKAVDQLGRLDIVVANAGVLGPTGPSWEMTREQWSTVVDINLTGVWETFRATLPHVIAGGRGGSVIAISSIAGLRGVPNASHYTASKHGVVGLIGSLANELAQHGIRANTVHPTNVRTPMIDNPGTAKLFRPDLEAPTLDDSAEALRAINLLPVPWVDAKDVSAAVLWLASDDSRYVTGASLPVDAGMLAKHAH
ncbi:mycofactocin-coupled SDR family oxidoreductase [Aeromicrobium fastidiosum]|uniref:mycofactocin-coupled SDR family oxidoreductase n=1 Tax=Aeromicrobium TaxID=2040 RepID=UPI00177B3AEA|nr:MULTISPECIES: mycofactocin-coupled SDR family oxidoreductase [Aeromicrobium]MBD8605495.1 mycofactocin-coupled SDR family oxidoreductase [Aeromicrobium sp. CFBP 8757]MCL8250412.1 mycofactocin-coupled SDR family oxidoreductase [Aeromicrobium fastidiosum]